MSVLGRDSIISRIRSCDLVVSPILAQDQIGPVSIDLRVGNIVLIVRSRGASHVDPSVIHKTRSAGSAHDKELVQQQKHERYEIPFCTKFLLHPGSLALVPTLEWVRLPPDLMGTVTARSTWAREGLNIATATIVEPGYRGIVTLELANFGEIPIALYPGLRIAQIYFTAVDRPMDAIKDKQFDLSIEPRQGNLVKQEESRFLSTHS